MSQEFDWHGEHVAVKQVEAIAVFLAEDGDIVIRQRNSMGDDDALIMFPAGQAKAVIEAIKKAARG